MTTPSCQSLPKPILKVSYLLYAALPKTFPYLWLLSWYFKTYTKAAWHCKDVAKEHANLCKVKTNMGVVLKHVTNVAVTVLQGNSLDDFKD